MTTITHRQTVARRWTFVATVAFLAMVGGWVAFFALTLFSPSTLSELSSDIRGLPLVVEALVWIAAFPFVLAVGVWETSWAEWLRVVLVASFAVGWTVGFLPRRTAPRPVDADRTGNWRDNRSWFGQEGSR